MIVPESSHLVDTEYMSYRNPLIATLLLLLAGGCQMTPVMPKGDPADFVTPTVAVMKFDNQAGSFLSWNLGSGMRDILVDRLVATKRFRVIERPELDFVISELQLQQSGITREQRKAKLGKVKNVQYLIKGTITDFGHVSSLNAFGGTEDLGVFGGQSRAVMGMILYVVDVESGEIIASESLQQSVYAASVEVKARYKGVAFGGSAFYQTPLGEATHYVVSRAVAKTTGVIASRPWTPRIAAIADNGDIILNGGRDRGIRTGASYEVLGEGRPIFDPETGDVLGRLDQPTLGVVSITKVAERYSIGRLVTGANFKVGSECRPVR